jgi:hypothetical protein
MGFQKTDPRTVRRLGNIKMRETRVRTCFLMDCTASMEPWIQAAKNQIVNIVNGTDALDYEVAFVGYRDYGDQLRFHTFHFMGPRELVGCIEDIHALGGNDTAEDVAGGLLAARELNWTNSDVRTIVHIADAPCHGLQFHARNVGDRYPQGDPSGIDPLAIMKHFSDREFTYTFVRINSSTDTMLEAFHNVYNAPFVVLDLEGQSRHRMTDGIVRSVNNSIERYTASQDPAEE